MTTTLTTGGRLASSLVASRGASSSSSCSNTTTTRLFGVRAVHRSTFRRIRLTRKKEGRRTRFDASRRNATNDGTNDVGGGGEEDDGNLEKDEDNTATTPDVMINGKRFESNSGENAYTIARKDGGEVDEDDREFVEYKEKVDQVQDVMAVSYTHLTLPTTPYV